MSEQITVKEYVAEKLMVQAGWSLDERETSLEWDANHPDSQYSIMLEIAEDAIHAVMEILPLIQGGKYQFPERDESDVISSSSTQYLFLEPTEESPITIYDVRVWLSEAEALGATDSFTVEGFLHLMFDENQTLISREHPSVITKEESVIRQLELDTARKKIDHLVKEGDYQEAERILHFIRQREGQGVDS